MQVQEFREESPNIPIPIYHYKNYEWLIFLIKVHRLKYIVYMWILEERTVHIWYQNFHQRWPPSFCQHLLLKLDSSIWWQNFWLKAWKYKRILMVIIRISCFCLINSSFFLFALFTLLFDKFEWFKYLWIYK